MLLPSCWHANTKTKLRDIKGAEKVGNYKAPSTSQGVSMHEWLDVSYILKLNGYSIKASKGKGKRKCSLRRWSHRHVSISSPQNPFFIKIKMVVLWCTMAAYVSNGRDANPILNYQHISYKYSNTFVVILLVGVGNSKPSLLYSFAGFNNQRLIGSTVEIVYSRSTHCVHLHTTIRMLHIINTF
jgi:hypothetical protein